MPRYVRFTVLIVLAVSLCACMAKPAATQPTTVPTTQPTTVPTTPPTTEPTTEPTKPEHSQLYIPGVSVEDVIRYFNEVSLDAEFTTNGDPSKLQKWTEPIRYQLQGSYTQQDIEVLDSVALWLNGVEGFPGFYEAAEGETANLQIHFCSGQEMPNILGENFRGMDGGVTFWYNWNDEIYEATICYRNDIDQYVRNSVILEEIFNGLGPVQDTHLRPDSIAYAEYSTPQSLTAVDELILRLLYHPLMLPGMDAAQCEAVIRQLYY